MGDMNKQQKENLEHLRNYIAAMGDLLKATAPEQAKYYTLMLEQGETFVDMMRSRELIVAKEYKRTKRPKIKRCFYNAKMLLVYADKASQNKY